MGWWVWNNTILALHNRTFPNFNSAVWAEFPMGSKFNFYQCNRYFFECKLAFFYVNFSLSIDSKLGFLNIALGNTYFLAIFFRLFNIFKYWLTDCTSKFFPIHWRYLKIRVTEYWWRNIKWTRLKGSWKFLNRFLVISEQQISIFHSNLLMSGRFTI